MMFAPLTGCFGETVTMFIGALFGNYLESKWVGDADVIIDHAC